LIKSKKKYLRRERLLRARRMLIKITFCSETYFIICHFKVCCLLGYNSKMKKEEFDKINELENKHWWYVGMRKIWERMLRPESIQSKMDSCLRRNEVCMRRQELGT
jgi:hypothetical protein